MIGSTAVLASIATGGVVFFLLLILVIALIVRVL